MATDSTKYISLAGLGHFLGKLKSELNDLKSELNDNATYDDNVISNDVSLGITEIDSGLRFPGESDTTGNNSNATNKGLVLSNSVLKSRGREINWNGLDGTTNLNFITSPGVYTITGQSNSSSTTSTSNTNLPHTLRGYGKFQVRLAVTKIMSEGTNASGVTSIYENIIQHIDYIDSAVNENSNNYGSFVRKGHRSYNKNLSGSTETIVFKWTSWEKLNKDTVYTHPNSGVTANSYGQESGATLSYSGSFKIPRIAVNAQGHITSASDVTITLPAQPTISISTATDDALGGIKTGYEENGQNYPVELDGGAKAYVNVPWTDTKVKSSKLADASTSMRYLLGHSSTATTAAANTYIGCYMKTNYLYSNGKKVDMSTSMSLPITSLSATSVTLEANTCTYMGAAHDGLSITLGTGKSDLLTTHMICFSTTGVESITFPSGVSWMDGEPPTAIITNGSTYDLPAGFYEFIFTKYGGTSAPTTATWAVYR